MSKSNLPLSPVQEPYDLGNNIYWVGKRGLNGNLDCNPYLIIEQNEAVLIDPGSPLDFEVVKANVESLISLDKITLVIVHHQDPDLCASLTLFEEAGINCPIALHWRTSTMVHYYGVKNPFYLVNEERWSWNFSTGRQIDFFSASYCHFPGAIISFDSLSGTLFSGDLFGAYVKGGESLFAGENYIESMVTFHEHYMPSHDILKAVLSNLIPLEIHLIAPQHGRIIKRDISLCLSTLLQLKCGSLLLGATLPKEGDALDKISLLVFLNSLLTRVDALFPQWQAPREWENTGFHLVEGEILSFSHPLEGVVDSFLEHLEKRGGSRWITILLPFIITLLDEAHLPMPPLIWEMEGKHFTSLEREDNPPPSNPIQYAGDHLLFDSLTGAHNQTFLKSYVEGVFSRDDFSEQGILYIGINNLLEINRVHGREAGDEILRSLTYLLDGESKKSKGSYLFKLNNPIFVFAMECLSPEQLYEKADRIVREVRDSNYFIEKINLSIGLTHFKECHKEIEGEITFSELDKLSKAKVQIAQERGFNSICKELVNQSPQAILQKRVLFVEPDDSYIELLSASLNEKGVHVTRVSDGALALDRREGWNPDLIVAEAMTPKVNGFQLKEKLNSLTGRSDTPFILISQRKDEEYIKRAAYLQILHYIKKPFSLVELEGLILNLLG
jgi:two-component system, cell cycle response regulator